MQGEMSRCGGGRMRNGEQIVVGSTKPATTGHKTLWPTGTGVIVPKAAGSTIHEPKKAFFLPSITCSRWRMAWIEKASSYCLLFSLLLPYGLRSSVMRHRLTKQPMAQPRKLAARVGHCSHLSPTQELLFFYLTSTD